MKLGDLTPGQRFRLPDSGKTGAFVSTGQMGSRVMYDSARRVVSFVARDADDQTEVAFEAPGGVVIISDATVVELL